MHHFMEHYGKLILYAIVGILCVRLFFSFFLGDNTAVSDGADKSFYHQRDEETMQRWQNMTMPTIVLVDKQNLESKNTYYTTDGNSIHLYLGKNNGNTVTSDGLNLVNFKNYIELTDCGRKVDCQLVNYRILSTNYNYANPSEGYYLIKYWYRSPFNDTVTTYIVTLVVH